MTIRRGTAADHAALMALFDQAVERGAELLRVDCWAGAPRLVRWYEEQGFTRSGTFAVGDWHGQVFEMPVSDRAAGR